MTFMHMGGRGRLILCGRGPSGNPGYSSCRHSVAALCHQSARQVAPGLHSRNGELSW